MKRIILLYGIIILFGLMLISCQAESDTNDITFTDEHLEKAVRKAIDQHDGVIKQSDIEKITELDAENLSIQSLDGIETLQSLKTLNIKGNKITDFSLLKELKNIKTINVIGNPLDDTKQLATLSKLSNQGIRVIRMEEAEGPGGFLWKVTNGKTTVYLQGTMHAGVQDMYPLHEKIEEAYAEADVVVPEVDITNLDFNEMQELMFLLGTYEDGTTIKDHLPKDVYDQLLTVLEELELTPDLIAQYKPWFIASTIESMLVQKYRFEHGVDEYFLNRAAEDGKKIVALETAEQQFRIFADRSDAFQIDYLTSSLESINGYEDSMRELMSLYMNGDVNHLLQHLTEDLNPKSEEEKIFMEEINNKRNFGMADKVMEFLEKGDHKTYFVIVGTLHLIEKPHIISILQEKGYNVTHVH